jgi:hypothetical protein
MSNSGESRMATVRSDTILQDKVPTINVSRYTVTEYRYNAASRNDFIVFVIFVKTG